MSEAMTTPTRSLAQRMEALQRANNVRQYRARLKARMKAGEEAAVDVLRDPPALVGTMKVFDLLLATPTVGRVKAGKTLAQCNVSPSKTVGGLSERQRGEMMALLSRQARGRRVPRVL